MKLSQQNRIQAAIKQAIDHEKIVGTSVLVAHHGEVIFESHCGMADRENNIPVTDTTIFRLASLTKPLVSAAALALIEQGKLALEQAVTNWLPEFTPKMENGESPVITIRHLLTHTAGLSYGFLTEDNEPYRSAGVSDGIDESVLSVAENLKRLAQVPLLYKPGTAWCYSLATDVLGAVLEQVCQKSLADIVEQYVTSPLAMTDATFYLKDNDRLTKAYADAKQAGEKPRLMQAADQVVLEGCGPIHYAPGRIQNAEAYHSGGAGMAATAKDYLKFLEAIRLGGQSILSEASVKLMTEDAVPDYDVAAAGPGYGFGYGFAVVRDAKEAATPRNQGSYEWGGVYGAKMFVDPKQELSVVMLTNTALEGLMGDFSVAVTEAIYDEVSQMVSESELVLS